MPPTRSKPPARKRVNSRISRAKSETTHLPAKRRVHRPKLRLSEPVMLPDEEAGNRISEENEIEDTQDLELNSRLPALLDDAEEAIIVKDSEPKKEAKRKEIREMWHCQSATCPNFDGICFDDGKTHHPVPQSLVNVWVDDINSGEATVRNPSQALRNRFTKEVERRELASKQEHSRRISLDQSSTIPAPLLICYPPAGGYRYSHPCGHQYPRLSPIPYVGRERRSRPHFSNSNEFFHTKIFTNAPVMRLTRPSSPVSLDEEYSREIFNAFFKWLIVRRPSMEESIRAAKQILKEENYPLDQLRHTRLDIIKELGISLGTYTVIINSLNNSKWLQYKRQVIARCQGQAELKY